MAEVEQGHSRRILEVNLSSIAVCVCRHVLALRTLVLLLTLSAAASQLQAQVAATPTFSPAAGTYTAAQSVTLTSTTSGATIYYTTDGTAPSTSSPQYSGPITVSASETILAFAGAPGYTNSTVGSAAYAIYPYGVITTIAGNGIAGYSGDGGAATSAEVNLVEGVTADGSGNVYFADIASNCVRKITGGVITTVAGTGTQGFSGDGGAAISAQLFHPQGVAIDGGGNLYIVDTGNYRIRKVTPAGIISTIAGNGTNGSSGDGAAATSAQLLPTAIAVDGVGNLYIGDANHERIRMVTLAGTISTIAGNGTAGFTGDGGAATSAELNEPQGVAVDPTGNVYIADFVNHRIRKVTPSGVISTFAGNGTVGSGGDGGAATSAALQSPLGVFADNQGNLYLADATGSRIREVNTSGIISTVAGTGTQGFGGDGGLATLAEVNSPYTLAVDSVGNLYIGDLNNHRVREVIYQATVPPPGQADTPTISPGTGTYTTIQNVTLSDGTSGVSFYYTTDGSTPTTSSTLYTGPIAVSASETLQAIAVPTTGTSSAVASATYTVNLMTQPPVILPAAATYAQPQTITMSSVTSGATIYYTTDGSTPTTSSAVYSAPFTLAATETIKAIANSSAYGLSTVTTAAYTYSPSLGTINTIAGSTTAGFSGDGGTAISATLNNADGLVLDSVGNIYIADNANHRIRKVTPAGVISTVAGNGTAGYSGDGGAATSAALHSPQDMVVDSAGNLYIADAGNNVIRKVTPAGIISTIAGTGSAGYNGDGGSATNAMLNFPRYVTLDSGGNLYISDSFNGRIRKVTPAGIISTYAGNGTSGFSGDGGVATNAAFGGNVDGLVFDSAGNLYIADVNNARIRMVTPAGIISTYAGNGTQGSSGDGGAAINAAIEDPEAITIDLSGNIYVGSYGAYDIRKITPAGIISTVAGGGSSLAEGVAATFASLAAGFGVAVDSAGNIYITSLNEVRKVTYGPPVQVATPVITPTTGTYTSLQMATITDATPGAVIFYTTDGSTPTEASTRYTGAFSVVASETINAFAVSSGYLDSAVANAAIAISVPTAVALTSSKNPSLFGDSITFTGVVSPSSSGNQVPTGTLTFTDGSTSLGTAAVTSQGVVSGSISTSALVGGTHSINVSYSGDVTFAPSTSTITQQVNPIAPTITWVTPVAIATGTALSAIQLDAAAKSPISGASVPGTYQYTPASGTILSAGQQILSVTFTPTDLASYTTATATVSLTIAQAPTTTLTVTSAGGAVSTVASGSVVTLTAAVAYPVTTGQINFCDATAANCTDIHLLGTAQLTSAGTAVLKFVPGIGNHSYKAVFIATTNYPSGVSAAEPLAVTGTYPTLTTITSTGNPGNYTLTAATTGVGSNALSPTGVVSFLDTSNSNMSLGTATLSGVTNGFGFVSSSTPATGIYPYSSAVGDFNGDGKLDLAVANTFSNSLTILLGNGDGTFAPAPSPATGTNPHSVTEADFNGDGNLDLAVTNAASNTVTVLLGNGDGTFVSAPSPPTGVGPSFLKAGDFNGDGKTDLVVTNGDGNTLTVLLGNGDGTFTAASSTQTGSNPAQIAIGDFNGDGKPDLAITYGLSKTVTILLGNGDGTFTSATGLSTTAYPTGVAAGDFNGDGKPDLAVSEVNTLNIFTGNGDGTFTAGSVLTGYFLPSSATVADFNDDGKVDLALAMGGNTTPTILLGNGDGTFKVASTSIPPGSTSSTFIVAGDFNGDGIADVAFPDNISSSHTTTGNLRVFLAQLTSTASATATGVSPITPGVHSVVASYPGDTNFNASTSAPTALTIPSLMFTSFTPNTGQLGDSAKTITISGVGFVAGTLAQINGTNIATTIVNSTSLTAIVPASYFNAIGTLQITLSNSAAGEMTAAFPLIVTAPAVAATITAPNTSAPGTQPAVTFSLGAPYPLPLIATFTLNDRSAIASGAVDPAVQFASGGTTYTVTIPSGATTIPIIPVQAGTIAATITVPVTLTTNGINVTPGTLAATIVVPPAVPDVTATTLARSGTTLTITESGFSNTREIVSASFHFVPVAGATLTTTDFTAPVGQDFATWFAGSTSLSYGSAFSYTQVFNVSDDASKIASVQVTLTNSVGVSTTQTAQ